MTFEELKKSGKKVTLELVGLDGKAFSLMGAFQQAARKQGWKKEEVDAVLGECRAGDYDYLICTLMEVCESPEVEEDEEDFEEEEDEDEEDEEEN
jgi:hypothetical protein